MLPIDEHAKSGAWVYVRLYGNDGAMYKVSWCEEGQCFAGYGRGFSPDLVTHYLPVPLVEHAAAMRADLVGWDATYPGVDDTVNILAATEWPKKEAK